MPPPSPVINLQSVVWSGENAYTVRFAVGDLKPNWTCFTQLFWDANLRSTYGNAIPVTSVDSQTGEGLGTWTTEGASVPLQDGKTYYMGVIATDNGGHMAWSNSLQLVHELPVLVS